MKRLFILWLLVGSFMPAIYAQNPNQKSAPRMSQQDFRNKQRAYVVEKAGLTEEEANAFFPLFFELEDRKSQLNQDSWELIRKGGGENVSEKTYEEILEGMSDSRIASERLEKAYLDKYKKVLSCKKIFLVQKAMIGFHRDLLKDMRHKSPKYPKRDK